MDARPDELRAADRNFIGAWEKLVDHQPVGSVRWFGPVFAFVTGLPVALFNGLIVLEPARPADVGAAADWLRDEGVPHEAVLRESVGEAPAHRLEGRGFRRRPWIEPVMAIRPPAEPPRPTAGVSVRVVEDEAALEEHIGLVIAGGMEEPDVRSMYARSFVLDPDVRVFTAYLEGRPAGTSIAIRTGDTAGVYAVGTRVEARRRGVGMAVTWAAVDAGRRWGCSLVVLQSSEMGFGVYSSMGFRVIDRLILMRGPE